MIVRVRNASNEMISRILSNRIDQYSRIIQLELQFQTIQNIKVDDVYL